VAQQVVFPESELGKRKIQDELERVEIRLRHLQCDQLEIEHEQMKKQFSIDNEQLVIKNRMDNEQLVFKNQTENEQTTRHNKTTTVNNFMATMQLLNPQWRDDKRLVLQATDYLKNTTFNGSSAPQIENGSSAPQLENGAQSTDSISIGSVAFEMGLALTNAKAVAAGKHAAKLYRDRYGEPPSKHNQTIGGNVILVNSYTLRDRDLVQDAIKAAA